MDETEMVSYSQDEIDTLCNTAHSAGYEEGYRRRNDSAQSEIIRRADEYAKERATLISALVDLARFVGARH